MSARIQAFLWYGESDGNARKLERVLVTGSSGLIGSEAVISCPACFSSVESAVIERCGAFQLFACAACDLHFWHPRRMPDAQWYEQMYSGRDSAVLPLEPGHKFFLEDTQAPRCGELLDAGCGTGNFLSAAQAQGYSVTGIELDASAARFAKEHLGIERILPLTIAGLAAQSPAPKFDAITFFEVLEHQADPNEFLTAIQACLAPSGWIALSVPNRARWLTAPDTLDYPPNHFLRWNAASLRRFLDARGFQVLAMREEPLSVSYTARMLNGLLRSGLSSRMAGKSDPAFRDLMQMPAEEAAASLAAPVSARQRFVRMLGRLKFLMCFPAAGVALPFLRLRGKKGPYLYCLARRKH